MLSFHDEHMLDRFFSHGREERSPMGAILDMAELYSVHGPKERGPRTEEEQGHPRHCQCPACSDQLDAQPTAETRQNAKDEADHDTMRLLGSVSRRLAIIRQSDPKSHDVLAAYFGDAGAKWGASEHGRINALLGLTETGKKILTKEKRKSRGAKLELSDEKRLENTVATSKANAVTKSLVAQARVEAMALFGRATEAWLRTAPERKAGA